MSNEIKIDVPGEVVQQQSENLTGLLSPFIEGASFLADKIRLARLDVLHSTIKKTKQICDEENIELTALPNKFMIPFVEKCSNEDLESEMINRWASLLATTTQEHEHPHPTYIDILSQLSFDEARLLKRIWEGYLGKDINEVELLTDIYPEKNSDHYGKPIIGDKASKYGFLVMGASYDGMYPENNNLRSQNIHTLQILERQNLLRFDIFNYTEIGGKRYFEIYAILTPLGMSFTKYCEQYNSGV